MADDQLVAAEYGCRLCPIAPGLDGSRELIQLSDGLSVLIGKVDYEDTFEVAFDAEAAVKLHFRLSGAGTIAVGDREERIGEHSGAMLVTTDGDRKLERYDAGARERSVTVIASRSWLRDELADDLPQAMADALTQPPFYHPFPLNADMTATVTGLMDCSLTGNMRVMYARGCAYELIALTVAAMRSSSTGDNDIPARDARLIQEARDILNEHLVPDHTIQGLARQVGLNEAKLMSGFKHLYGQTIFDYCQSRRMEHARHLLEDTELSITEISFEVGYEYPSNFTTAFKRHFGVTPKVARTGYRLNDA